jgi:hypothetical protein
MREYYEAVLQDLKRVKLQTEQAIEALEKLADLHGPRVQAAPSKLMAAAYPAAYDAPVANKQAFQEAYAGTGFPPAPRPTPVPLPLADWQKGRLYSLEEKYPALDGHELGEYLDLRHRFDYQQYKEEQAEKNKAASAASQAAAPIPTNQGPYTQNQQTDPVWPKFPIADRLFVDVLVTGHESAQAKSDSGAAPGPTDPAPSTSGPDTQNQTLMEEAQALLDKLEPESPLS